MLKQPFFDNERETHKSKSNDKAERVFKALNKGFKQALTAEELIEKCGLADSVELDAVLTELRRDDKRLIAVCAGRYFLPDSVEEVRYCFNQSDEHLNKKPVIEYR